MSAKIPNYTKHRGNNSLGHSTARKIQSSFMGDQNITNTPRTSESQSPNQFRPVRGGSALSTDPQERGDHHDSLENMTLPGEVQSTECQQADGNEADRLGQPIGRDLTCPPSMESDGNEQKSRRMEFKNGDGSTQSSPSEKEDPEGSRGDAHASTAINHLDLGATDPAGLNKTTAIKNCLVDREQPSLKNPAPPPPPPPTKPK